MVLSARDMASLAWILTAMKNISIHGTRRLSPARTGPRRSSAGDRARGTRSGRAAAQEAGRGRRGRTPAAAVRGVRCRREGTDHLDLRVQQSVLDEQRHLRALVGEALPVSEEIRQAVRRRHGIRCLDGRAWCSDRVLGGAQLAGSATPPAVWEESDSFDAGRRGRRRPR